MSRGVFHVAVVLALAVGPLAVEAQDDDLAVAKSEALRVLEEFFEAFNAADNEELRALSNFPHVFVLGNGRLVIAQEAQDLAMDFERMRQREGWHHSTLDSAEVRQISVDKVHIDIVFSRYRADGRRYRTVPALWIVTRQDSHWGLQVRSLLPPTRSNGG